MESSWKPHTPIPVEQTWNIFIPLVGGKLISDMISKTPSFENADYLFNEEKIILELKEVETDFGNRTGVNRRFKELLERLLEVDPTWRPLLFGGSGHYPDWFYAEYLKALGKPVVRIIEKANSQIKATKHHFNIGDAQGVLLFVNDGFISLSPEIVYQIAIDALSRSYSSICCFVYITVNRYVDIPGSDLANLLWIPAYSPNASNELITFIQNLGSKWFDYLESTIGPFDKRKAIPDNKIFKGAKSIKI
jgi:hypothetical protein